MRNMTFEKDIYKGVLSLYVECNDPEDVEYNAGRYVEEDILKKYGLKPGDGVQYKFTKDENIVIFSRDSSSGTFDTWRGLVMNKEKVHKNALIQSSNGTVLAGIKGNPKAIGYIGYGYLNKDVKGLVVGGIQAVPANKDKYAIARELYMFTDKKTISDSASNYINFVKSAAGQKLVKEKGFIPLR